eukprot:1158333-Pelagomonas_calceolata.AAC.10
MIVAVVVLVCDRWEEAASQLAGKAVKLQTASAALLQVCLGCAACTHVCVMVALAQERKSVHEPFRMLVFRRQGFDAGFPFLYQPSRWPRAAAFPEAIAARDEST